MIRLLPHPFFSPLPPVSSATHTGRLRKRDNLLTGEWEGVEKEPNYGGEKAWSSKNYSILSARVY
jgi:hypothetical protein